MESRREFFKRAAALAGEAGVTAALLASIEKAAAIDPPQTGTFLDAEHVVILMQENRSFDHAYGRLRGVRGFNDPRAVTLPDGKPVWAQSNAAGETYAPFRLDLKNTKATWLGSLPHGWHDQTDARNHGNHDRWLDNKASGKKECAGLPLTMGYYDREDIPFYYGLADAFTICDQHFCSSLTGTTPNRLHLWTGTVRENAKSIPNVRNSEVDYGATALWRTFPERLEEAGVSWKIYQNELSWPTGLTKEEDAWLANFGDNPIEWFDQYASGFLETHRRHLDHLIKTLPGKDAAEKKLLREAVVAREQWSDEAFAKLNPRARALHAKAFVTNVGDPAYRELTKIRYRDGSVEREMEIPKGDVLHQFRQDVAQGKLPKVSWLVAPEKFSDHPTAPWYGAWYVAEALDILTRNPEVWKKTIFILTYDENDGYFDHVPPFVAPNPNDPESGKASAGIDTAVEYLTLEQDASRAPEKNARGGPIGLGYRVPMVIASPWSRGGYVCSQVFDHTSVLQLLERVVGKGVKETNISAWRRAICGDLSSAFRSPLDSKPVALRFGKRDAFLEDVHKAQFKPMPAGFRQGTQPPPQEPGVRPACALPYVIYAEGGLSADRKLLQISMRAAGKAGVPFHAYTPGLYRGRADLRTRAYAAAAGSAVQDAWELEGFASGVYHLRLCGPNGFLREMAGDAHDPLVEVRCDYAEGDVEVIVSSKMEQACTVRVKDESYGRREQAFVVEAGDKKKLALDLKRSLSWYDFSVRLDGQANFMRRYAGRVETGKSGVSDPAMGRTLR